MPKCSSINNLSDECIRKMLKMSIRSKHFLDKSTNNFLRKFSRSTNFVYRAILFFLVRDIFTKNDLSHLKNSRHDCRGRVLIFDNFPSYIRGLEGLYWYLKFIFYNNLRYHNFYNRWYTLFMCERVNVGWSPSEVWTTVEWNLRKFEEISKKSGKILLSISNFGKILRKSSRAFSNIFCKFWKN